ncbi:MAG: hypothetical protein BWY04_01021 [candidate division CPR1 bacterium ADurb.Bin160]|uniref:Rubrerythrin diiron-binding domain-containing protein n=1 Tax=candidate division CPR1 bacterium ADurb.Bin160 TaxID=1852826 RepID=A0A1V5ZLT4_9BACT|nr:MAG: hypothetical protein BWY04_01021 [candidate division CPR1 bacterium ADurb.Bin160]
MADFSNPFALKNFENGKNLSKSEIIGALRLAMNLENEAVQVYRFIAANCGFFNVEKIMKDLANEEVVHIGELIRLIFELDENEQELYTKGFREVEKMLKNKK